MRSSRMKREFWGDAVKRKAEPKEVIVGEHSGLTRRLDNARGLFGVKKLIGSSYWRFSKLVMKI